MNQVPAISQQLRNAELERQRRQDALLTERGETKRPKFGDYLPVEPEPAPTPAPTPEPQEIKPLKLFGRMGTRAQRLRHELSFRLWAVVRWLADGENHVPVNLVLETFSDNGRYAFTTRPNLRKQINKAIERGYMEYSADGDKIFFTSETRVALEVLGMSAVRGWAVSLSIEQLRQDFNNNRDLFRKMFHASRGDGFNNPISRQSIQEETGRGKRTQKSYEKRAKIQVIEQYEYVRGCGRRKPKPEPGYKRIWDGEQWIIGEQLPNKYSANLKTAKRSRRWLNQRITNLCKKSSDNGQFSPVIVMGACDTEIKQRRYFKRYPKDSANTERFYQLPGSNRYWKRVYIE